MLYGRADQSFFVRQIAREVHASVGAVQRELETLARIGLIVRKPLGSLVFYQVNQLNPVFSEMLALVKKTVGVFGVLQSALAPISERIAVAFVYGSVARQEETSASDVDLMIIGKVALEDVLSSLSQVETALGRPVNPTVYSVPEFQSKLKAGNHFLKAVLNGKKVFLIGNEDELGQMGGIRMAQARAKQPKRNPRSARHRATKSG